MADDDYGGDDDTAAMADGAVIAASFVMNGIYGAIGMWWYWSRYVQRRRNGEPTGQRENGCGPPIVHDRSSRAQRKEGGTEEEEEEEDDEEEVSMKDMLEAEDSAMDLDFDPAENLLTASMAKHQRDIVRDPGRHKMLLFFMFFFIAAEINADLNTAIAAANGRDMGAQTVVILGYLAAMIAGARWLVLLYAQYTVVCVAATGQGRGCCTACCCPICFFCPCGCGGGCDDWSGADHARMSRSLRIFFTFENAGNKLTGHLEQALDFGLCIGTLALGNFTAFGWSLPALGLSICGHIVTHDEIWFWECTNAAHPPSREEVAAISAAASATELANVERGTRGEATSGAEPVAFAVPNAVGGSGAGGDMQPSNLTSMASSAVDGAQEAMELVDDAAAVTAAGRNNKRWCRLATLLLLACALVCSLLGFGSAYWVTVEYDFFQGDTVYNYGLWRKGRSIGDDIDDDSKFKCSDTSGDSMCDNLKLSRGFATVALVFVLLIGVAVYASFLMTRRIRYPLVVAGVLVVAIVFQVLATVYYAELLDDVNDHAEVTWDHSGYLWEAGTLLCLVASCSLCCCVRNDGVDSATSLSQSTGSNAANATPPPQQQQQQQQQQKQQQKPAVHERVNPIRAVDV